MRILLPLLFLLAGCTLLTVPPQSTLLQGKVLLRTDTLWSGEVLIDGAVTVAYGTTLTIAPGTNVRFVRRDKDRDGLGDATIIVKGSLDAIGTQSSPIHFRSAKKAPKPGDWLEIRSDFAQQLNFDWCEFRDSAYTLHAHFTRGHLRNCHIHHNIDGCRLGRCRFLVQYNLIESNRGKGINFRDSDVTLTDNIIRDNRVGIFLFEKPHESVISRNNIYCNIINLRLGDFFTEDIKLSDNWWGESDPRRISQSIHDQQDDAQLGRAKTAPAADWLFAAGIQNRAQLTPLWRVSSSGFVDSTPVDISGRIFFASWDGGLKAVDQQGKILWQSNTGDIIDGSLLAVDGKIFLQNWSRQFYAVDQTSGRTRLIFEYPPSPADDHRQAGPALTKQLLLLPGWNGTLYAFDRQNLTLRWQYDAGLPLRATPLVHDSQIYLTSGSQILSVLNSTGHLLWKQTLAAPLLSSPILLPDGGIVVLDKLGTLSVFARDGVLLWRHKLEQTCFYAAPLVSGNGLFVATSAGDLWKFEPTTGQTVWVKSLGGSIYASPACCLAGLLVSTNEGILFLIDPDSGRTLATYKVGNAIQSKVLVAGNRLYFGSRDRYLHALRLSREGDSE